MTKMRSGISRGRRQSNTSLPALARRVTTIFFVACAIVLLLQTGTPDNNNNIATENELNTDGNRRMIRGDVNDGSVNTGTVAATSNKRTNDDDGDVVILSLELDDNDREENNANDRIKPTSIVSIRMRLYEKEAPEAARYVKHLASDAKQQCNKCTLYRGEPVPSYWGSEEYPDRYFDGGRWGPPYALVQGAFLADEDGSSSPASPPAESHNPIIERGMVAWAGGKGGPHFFIALAEHPEWEHGHTVFAKVFDDDMAKVDALLSRPLVNTKPKRPPIVSNFVDPIPLRIRMRGANEKRNE